MRIWYSPEVARWEIERGATPLADGSAVREIPAGEDWLVGEILSYRGEAAVLENLPTCENASPPGRRSWPAAQRLARDRSTR